MKTDSTDFVAENKEQSVRQSWTTEQLRIWKNLVAISFTFLFLYLPFQSLANLQSSMNAENNVGTISLSSLHAGTILSSLFLPKLIIKKFGCKSVLTFCTLAFLPYYAANFYPHLATFVPAAVLVGISSGSLMPAKNTYINEISLSYAGDVSENVDMVTSRFFGIFCTISYNVQIWGNLAAFFLLKPQYSEAFGDSVFSDNSTVPSLVTSLAGVENASCGADYCGGMNENLSPPSLQKRYVLTGLYLCSALLSVIIIVTLLDPLKEKPDDEILKISFYSRAFATWKHLRSTDQLLLIPLTIFTGIEKAFMLGDFSKAFVACPWGVHNVSLVFITFGVTTVVMSPVSGYLVKYVSRVIIILAAAATNIGVCIVLLHWRPSSDEIVYSFILCGMWGVSDAVWGTQLNVAYGLFFREEQEEAFANLMLWQCLGLLISYGYSSFLCLSSKVYILLTFTVVGILGYLVVEIRIFLHKKTYTVSDIK